MRARGQPIRLFGETDKDRRLRLRALELQGDRGKGDQNDFKKAVENLQVKEQERKARGDAAGEGKEEKRKRGFMADGPLDLASSRPTSINSILLSIGRSRTCSRSGRSGSMPGLVSCAELP